MSNSSIETSSTVSQDKLVAAPPPSDSSIIPSIYGIIINKGEEVEWQWLELPDSNRVVTNYKIIARTTIETN